MHQRADRGRRCGGAHPLRPPPLHLLVTRGAPHPQVGLPVPRRDQSVGVCEALFLCLRPRIVLGPGALCVTAVQHERCDPLRVGGGHQDRHRAALGVAAQHRAPRTDGVHDREHVVHPRLEVGQPLRPVRHPGAALVEADQPTHRAQPVEEVGVPRVGPVQLQVRDEAGDQHDVQIAAAGDLVGDVQAVADGVADRLHSSRRASAAPAARRVRLGRDPATKR